MTANPRPGRTILVAPDKFAGTLSATQAADAIAAGWRRGAPGDDVRTVPLADGGPGFLEALHGTLGGEVQRVETTGPLGEPVVAPWLLVGTAAYIEAATACGLALVPVERRDPVAATTAGLAALLRAALAAGAHRVVVGIGGTATTDGGRGLVEALPARWPPGVELEIATDVDNPLLGPDGAAAGFGPQKGATPADVVALEQRLTAWAAESGGDASAPGAGAGGGLGYGLMLLGGRRVSGSELVLDAVLTPELVAAAGVVVTGEGGFDWQSLRGKLVSAVAGRAQQAGRPCLVLAGRSDVGRRQAAAAGIDAVYSLVEEFGVDEAMRHPAERLADLAEHVAGAWKD